MYCTVQYTVHVYAIVCPTGNGEKFSSSQAQLGQATCLAVASFLSISCGANYLLARYMEIFEIPVPGCSSYFSVVSWYFLLHFERCSLVDAQTKTAANEKEGRKGRKSTEEECRKNGDGVSADSHCRMAYKHAGQPSRN